MIEFSIDFLVAILGNVRTHFYEDETSAVDFVMAIKVVVSFFHIVQFFLEWRSKQKLLESILISNPCNMYHIFDRSTFKVPAELL